MLPKIFLVKKEKYIYISYRTEEEFYQIKKYLEGFGFKRYSSSKSLYSKNGIFVVYNYRLIRSNVYLLSYTFTTVKIRHATYTVDDLLNIF